MSKWLHSRKGLIEGEIVAEDAIWTQIKLKGDQNLLSAKPGAKRQQQSTQGGSLSNECTTEDCGNHTATWLCGQCVSDLQQWIDKALLIMPELDVTIARLDVTRPGNPETRSTNVAGSAAPANLDALQLKLNMESIGPDAKVYALDPRAAGLAWLIQDWYTKAELLVSGPEEIHVNHAANKERIANIAPPMTTRQLLPWLRTNARIAITSMDIRNWARRGHLRPVECEPSPTYWPHEVLQAHKEARE